MSPLKSEFGHFFKWRYQLFPRRIWLLIFEKSLCLNHLFHVKTVMKKICVAAIFCFLLVALPVCLSGFLVAPPRYESPDVFVGVDVGGCLQRSGLELAGTRGPPAGPCPAGGAGDGAWHADD